jgi:thymidylate synthase (FAD)
MRKAVILTGDPVVIPIASMKLDAAGIDEMAQWVKSRRPECLPDGYSNPMDLFPHNGEEFSVEEGFDDLGSPVQTETRRKITDNELLVELAGRNCYHSFGAKAGRKTNKDYIAHTQSGSVPHASIMYHAKMSFFVAGISRRVSHELIRNYVGADRDQEGSPSQESTRFTHHYGYYVAHPNDLNNPEEMAIFEADCEVSHEKYCAYIERREQAFLKKHGSLPKGLDRKRIFEAAADRLSMSAETSFIWTVNPVSFWKMCKERGDEAADMEFQRLIRVWKKVSQAHWPNFFPG